MTLTPAWQAVASIVEQNTRDLIAGRFTVPSEVVSWFKALALFRETEVERLMESDPTSEDLNWHRAILATLLADGERLLLEWPESSAHERNADRISRADLEAAVHGLYSTQSMWHGDVTAEQRKAIIRQVFQIEPDSLRFESEA